MTRRPLLWEMAISPIAASWLTWQGLKRDGLADFLLPAAAVCVVAFLILLREKFRGTTP